MRLIVDIPDYKLKEVQNGSIASKVLLEALKNGRPYAERPQGDLVSREALKKAIFTHFDGVRITDGEGAYIIRDTNVIIDSVPASEPERARGRVIFDKDGFEVCSICGGSVRCTSVKYCENCGAEMVNEV